MTQQIVRLGPEDPTIFAKCPRCSATGLGTKSGSQFYRAYTRRRWQRKPKCDNCRTPMVMLYEVKEEKREEVSRNRTAGRPARPGDGARNPHRVAGRNREWGRNDRVAQPHQR